MQSRIPFSRYLTDTLAALAVGVAVFPISIWMLHPHGKAVDALAASSAGERAAALSLAMAASAYTFFRVWKNRHLPRIPWHE